MLLYSVYLRFYSPYIVLWQQFIVLQLFDKLDSIGVVVDHCFLRLYK